MGRTETRTRVAVGASLIFAACLGVAVAIPQARNAAVAAAVCVIVATVFVEAPEMTLLGFVVVRPVVDAFVYTSVGGLSLGEVWGIGLVAVTLAYLVAQEQVRMPLAPIALILAYASLTFVRPVPSASLSTGRTNVRLAYARISAIGANGMRTCSCATR